MLETSTWSRIRLLVDVVVLYLASCAALLAAPVVVDSATRWLAVGFPLIALVIMHARRDAGERLSASALDTIAQVLGATSVTAVLAIAAAPALGSSHPVALALRLWLFASVYIGVARCVLMSVRKQAVRNVALATPTLIVGAGLVGEHLAKLLANEPGYGLRAVGFLDADPLPRTHHSDVPLVPVLGSPHELADVVQRTRARHVIIAFSSEPDGAFVDTVRQCQQLGVEVSLVPRLYESINARATLDHVGGVPLLALQPTNPHSWQFGVKHTFDRVLAASLLLVVSPLMLVLAAAIRLSSPGPALFRQRRVGRDGRVFDVLKFRTMRESSDTGEFTPPDGCAPGGVEGADRRTWVGAALRRASLDELPQLLNVLRGDMSLVGPRPERPEFVKLFSEEVNRYVDRHRVKSGITGWAQVNGFRGQTSIADRVEWDNYYIQNWSLRFDLRIIAMTVAELLRLRG